MSRFMPVFAVLCCLPAAIATAESATGIPAGYVQAFRTGKIAVHTASKTALTVEQQNRIQKALKALYDRYTTQYGLDKETYRPGSVVSFDVPKDTVDLVIFPDLEKFQEWCGNKAAGGLTSHI